MVRDNLLENNPLLIVDVGASGGIDSRWAKFTSFYKGVLFEPDPREYDILKSKSGKHLVVLNSALSNSVGTMDFYLCEKQQVSSVYLPNVDFLCNFPDAKRFDVTSVIRVKTDTLDNQLRTNEICEIDFIKIDTQGHELPILKGGSDYLKQTIGLEVEVEFALLYKNQPLFNEVDSFLRENGFVLFDIKRYYWKRKGVVNVGSQKGQLVFGDALYFRNPEQVLLLENITEKKIVRSIYVYLAYGYSDLARTLLNNANSKKLLTKAIYDAVAVTLLKQEKNMIPNFRGKGRIRYLFENIAKRFSGGWYSGTDKTLGND